MSQSDFNGNGDKKRILTEIRRTAEANGGVPLGRAKFLQETGIKDSDWLGKIWARWGDAIVEAGLQPNRLQIAYDPDLLIEKFIGLARDLGHFPVVAEVKMKARGDTSFPWHNTFARFGSKREFAERIVGYCNGKTGYEDIVALCEPIAERQQPKRDPLPPPADSAANTKDGYVYLGVLKLGREKRYKIGKAVLVERRRDQISLQLPEDLELVHAITTDDDYGIEEYWHRRFASKNTKGEWFVLSRQDIDAFRRRKFM
jgi:hypothetical protein